MSKHELVYRFVASKIAYLNTLSNQNSNVYRALLANMRRGVGHYPGELPELWGIIFDRLPEELYGQGKPSGAEWAIYSALTLYALHQQGSEESVHCADDISIGKAAAALVKSEDDTDRILKRLNLIATSVSTEDLVYHLRGLIQLLKGESVKLDYARMAKELYLFQYADAANDIRIAWGRDFYRQINHLKENKS